MNCLLDTNILLVQNTPTERHWDGRRWRDLYDVISGYFKNLRHVYRFLGSFSFHVRRRTRGAYAPLFSGIRRSAKELRRAQ